MTIENGLNFFYWFHMQINIK